MSNKGDCNEIKKGDIDNKFGFSCTNNKYLDVYCYYFDDDAFGI